MKSIFVSSTFRDMNFERDILNKSIAPKLNYYLSEHNQALRVLDLRWGVDTSDMNIEEGEENYLQFVNSGFMYDTKHNAENTINYLTYHDVHPSEHEKSIIDYVMINDSFSADTYRVVTAGIDGKYVSDHFPIYADLYIK